MNLVIGIGGTGGNTIKNLKYRFELYRKTETVTYVDIDTISPSEINKRTVKVPRSTIERSEYLSYEDRPDLEFINELANNEYLQDGMFKWFKAHKFKNELRVSDKLLTSEAGAGQYRQLGRIQIYNNIRNIFAKINTMFGDTKDTLNSFIVCSNVGGTGSGGAHDIATCIRSIGEDNGKSSNIFLFMALDSAFADVISEKNEKFKHNPERSYAFLRELHRLMNAYGAGNELQYSYSAQNKVKIKSNIYDGVFLADMKEFEALTGEDLRNFGLYPALADCIEIFTENNTGTVLEQDIVNINKIVRNIQSNEQLDEEDLKTIDDLSRGEGKFDLPKFEPYFSTFATHRIYFPKILYKRKFHNQIIQSYLTDLFKVDIANNVIKSNLHDSVEDEIKSFLNIWNSQINSGFYLDKTTIDRLIEDKQKDFYEHNIRQILRMIVTEPYLSEANTLSDFKLDNLKENFVSSKAEIDNFVNTVKQRKEKFLGKDDEINESHNNEFQLRLSKFRKESIGKFNQDIISTLEAKINPDTWERKMGGLGGVMEILKKLNSVYFQKFLEFLNMREEEIKNMRANSIARVKDAENNMNEAETGFLKRSAFTQAQNNYLQAENNLFDISKRLVANRCLTETIKECTLIVEKWLKAIEVWSTSVVTHRDSLLNLIIERKSGYQAELENLAKSPNISIGVPQDVGNNKFTSPKTDMGGYEEYLFKMLDSDIIIQEWLQGTRWNLITDGNTPSIRLDVTDKKSIENRDVLEQNLRLLAEDRIEPKLKGFNVFSYLVDYLPNRDQNKLTITETAKSFAKYLHDDVKPLFEYTAEGSLDAYYFFYKANIESNESGFSDEEQLHTQEIQTFISELESEFKKLKPFGTFQPISNYEADEIFGFVHLVHGLTISSCTTTKRYLKSYLEKLNKTNYMMDIIHIFPEEQSMVNFEMKENISKTGQQLTVDKLIPSKIAPMFSDTFYLEKFIDFLSIGLISHCIDTNIHIDKANRIFYYWTGEGINKHDIKTDADELGINAFWLSKSFDMFEAMCRFVNKNENLNTKSTQKSLANRIALSKRNKDILKELQEQMSSDLSSGLEEEILYLKCKELKRNLTEDKHFLVMNTNMKQHYGDSFLEQFNNILYTLVDSVIEKHKNNLITLDPNWIAPE